MEDEGRRGLMRATEPRGLRQGLVVCRVRPIHCRDHREQKMKHANLVDMEPDVILQTVSDKVLVYGCAKPE